MESRSDLRAALEAAVAEPGPYLLNVQVTPFENVYPMVPARSDNLRNGAGLPPAAL